MLGHSINQEHVGIPSTSRYGFFCLLPIPSRLLLQDSTPDRPIFTSKTSHSQLLFTLDEILVPKCPPGLKKKEFLLKEELSED